MFETNYFACAAMMQAVTPAMVQQRSGTIVNVGSIAAYCYTPFFGHYCATKAALKMLSDTARLELK
jgi:short-subunit dehydrogenase